MSHSGQLDGGKPAGPSADEILDELEERLERMTESDFDCAEIERMIGRLEGQMPLRTAFDPEAAWNELENRHPLFFEDDARSGALSRPVFSHRPRRRMPALLAAVLAAVVLLAGMITAQAMGLDIFGVLARWTDEEFQFVDTSGPSGQAQGQPRPAVNEEVFFDSLEDAFTAYGITTPLLPTWLPEGYVCTKVSVTGTPENVIYHAGFSDGENAIGLGLIESTTEETRHFSVYEKDETDVVLYESHGIVHYIFGNSGGSVISWVNDDFECFIDGYFSLETAKKIVDSIYD